MYYDYDDFKEMIKWCYGNNIGTFILGERYDDEIYDEDNDKFIPLWKFVKICRQNGYEG
jgi:hypothetical protein